MKKVKFLLAAGGVLGLLLLGLAGCRGSDDADASLTKEEFVQQGNAICKAGEEERGKLINGAVKLVKPGEKISHADQEKVIETALVEPYRKMTKKLENLGAPEGEEDEVQAIIKAMEDAADEAEKKPLANLHGDDQFREAGQLVTQYGLTNCAV